MIYDFIFNLFSVLGIDLPSNFEYLGFSISYRDLLAFVIIVVFSIFFTCFTFKVKKYFNIK